MDNFILTNVIPPLIILVGISGNTFGQILVGRKKVSKIGPVLIYKCLFMFDNINLSIIIILFILIIKIINLYYYSTINSNASCT